MNSVMVCFLILLSVVPYTLFYFKKRRNIQTVKKQSVGEDFLLGTDDDRVQAEQALKAVPFDRRDEILKTKTLFKRYTSHLGYSDVYMEQLAQKVREAGIECEVYFVPNGPLGFADSIIVSQGIYELYVDRGQFEKAQDVIPQMMSS